MQTSEQSAIFFSRYNADWLVCVTEMEYVSRVIWTESLNEAQVNFRPKPNILLQTVM